MCAFFFCIYRRRFISICLQFLIGFCVCSRIGTVCVHVYSVYVIILYTIIRRYHLYCAWHNIQQQQEKQQPPNAQPAKEPIGQEDNNWQRKRKIPWKWIRKIMEMPSAINVFMYKSLAPSARRWSNRKHTLLLHTRSENECFAFILDAIVSRATCKQSAILESN